MKSKTVARLLEAVPKDVAIFVDWYADIVVRINQLLREQQMSKKELAEKLDKNPSEISKWLGGEHNFTLRSLAKISAELGEPLLVIPPRKPPVEFQDGIIIKLSRHVTTINNAVSTSAKFVDIYPISTPSNHVIHAG
jgi:transcriptional regulator with XRE-family HTH domain